MMGTKFWEDAIWALFKEGYSKHLLSGALRFRVRDNEEAWFQPHDVEMPIVFHEAYINWHYDPMGSVLHVIVVYKKKVSVNIPGEVLDNYLTSEFFDWFVTQLYYNNLIELTDEQKYWNELYFEKGASYPEVYEKTVPYVLLKALERRLDKYTPLPAPFKQGYADSGTKLMDKVPGLGHIVMDGCPVCKEKQGVKLLDIIVHLNDKHKWPRVAEDWPKPGYKGPTIVDWVEEYAIEMHLDMTFHEEIKSEPPF